MSTGYEVTRGAVDWWSRWMAFGSLLVAGACIAWSYNQFRQIPDREDIVGLIHQRAINLERDESQARSQREQANQQLIAEVRDEARTIFDEHKKLIAEVTTLKTDLARADQSAPSDGTSGNTTNKVTRAGHNEKADEDTTLAPPENAVATTVNRPAAPADKSPSLGTPDLTSEPVTTGSEGDNSIVTQWNLRTGSSRGVHIEGIEFRPTKILELANYVKLEDVLATSSDVCRIVLTPDDNQSQRPGHQGRYMQTLLEAYHVPANTVRDLLVVIDDPSHAGYALQGELKIMYGATEPLVIEQFIIPFAGTGPVAADDETAKSDNDKS